MLGTVLIMNTQAWAQTIVEHFDPEADPAVYITRYIHDESFAAWYDEYYPDLALYDALGITEDQYNEIIKSLESADECEPGTILRDGECVPEQKGTTGSVQYATQGAGLQIGVGAVGAFVIALAVILLLWLPNRIRKWYAQRN